MHHLTRHEDLMTITVTALENLGGRANEKAVCKWFWENYQADLRADEDLFFTWQQSVHRALDSLLEQGRVAYCTQSSEWLLLASKHATVAFFDVEPTDRSARRKEIALLYEHRA